MSLDHVAASILRDDLTNGTFRPGERLREIPLARRLSFSRSTVRKALQFLGEEGLVVLVPYTGWLVAKLEASDIEELVMLRSALEGLASRLAAGRAATIEGRLTAALDRLEEAARDKNRAMVIRADFELHEMIVDATGHTRLVRHYGLVAQQIRLLIASSDSLIGDLDVIVEQHRTIVASILSGDPDWAESVAKRHNLVDGEALLHQAPHPETPSLPRSGETARHL